MEGKLLGKLGNFEIVQLGNLNNTSLHFNYPIPQLPNRSN